MRIILRKTIPTLFGNLGRPGDTIEVPDAYAELVIRNEYAKREPKSKAKPEPEVHE